jgi:hypothetical protein
LDIKKRLKQAVQSYWDARGKNREKQIEGGKIDAGTRGEVTGVRRWAPWKSSLPIFCVMPD